MADCSLSMSAAFNGLHGQGRILHRRHCFYHVKTAIVNNISEYAGAIGKEAKKELKKKMELMLLSLHYSNAAQFGTLFDEMTSELDRYPEYANYLKNTYKHQISNWCIGDAFYVPTCNNQLEGYNGHIKTNEMARLKLDIKQFLDFMMELLHCESRRRNPQSQDKKLFAGTISIDQSTVNEAVSLKEDQFPTCTMRIGQTVIIDVRDKKRVCIVREIPDVHISIHTFSKTRDSHVCLYKQTDKILCTCVKFAEKYMCPHAYIFECANGMRGVEGEHKSGSQKRGRPKLMGPALTRNRTL